MLIPKLDSLIFDKTVVLVACKGLPVLSVEVDAKSWTETTCLVFF